MNWLQKTSALTLLGSALLCAAPVQAAEPAACRTVRFAEVGWADISATNAITAVLLEGLGYEPDAKLTSVPIAFNGVANNQLDTFLGYWSPTMDSMAAPLVKEGKLKVLDKPDRKSVV